MNKNKIIILFTLIILCLLNYTKKCATYNSGNGPSGASGASGNSPSGSSSGSGSVSGIGSGEIILQELTDIFLTPDYTDEPITCNLDLENHTNITLFQYIRAPQPGKSLLNELLFLPPEFYNNPLLEEGFNVYAICHSGFIISNDYDNGGDSGSGESGGNSGSGTKDDKRRRRQDADNGNADDKGSAKSGRDNNATSATTIDDTNVKDDKRRRRQDDSDNDSDNSGSGNSGNGNSGSGNNGSGNNGSGNNGSGNNGSGNNGSGNNGSGNNGSGNNGSGNNGSGNNGSGNNGSGNNGSGNNGSGNNGSGNKGNGHYYGTGFGDNGAGDTSAANNADDDIGNINEGIIKCKNSKLIFQYGNTKLNKIPNCKTKYKFDVFEKIEFNSLCNSKVYAVGLNISGKIITFAESCFDIIKNKIQFIHYLYKPSNPIANSYLMPHIHDDDDELMVHDWDYKEKEYRTLKRSVNNNNLPNEDLIRRKKALYIIFNSSTEGIPYKPAVFPDQYLEPSTLNISDTLSKNIDGQVNFLKFIEADLFPPNIFAPYITDIFNNLKFLQSFIGWENLIYGNWKTLHELLKQRMVLLADSNLQYNIHAGTSHISEAVIPDCTDLKELGVKIDGKIKAIPKYIWMHINSKETNEDYVIIGINSPYNPFFTKSEIFFCDDICDSIEWIKPLYIMRKINTFGRIFCCSKSQTETFLNGFPVRASMISAETYPPGNITY